MQGRSASSPHLFSGLLKCSECGANISIVSGRGRSDVVYGCPQNTFRGACVCTNGVRVFRKALEEKLLTALQEQVIRPEAVEYVLDNNVDVEFLEYARSGGAATLDMQGTTSNANCFGSGGSACIGPALTLAGSNELVIQWISQANGITSISGGAYTNPFDNDATNVFGAFAGALNQSTATAQTWVTTGSSGGYTAMSAIAFK